MGKAMALAEGFHKTTDEYKLAVQLNNKGELFQKITSKKYADLAESVLSGTFEDLMQEATKAEMAACEVVIEPLGEVQMNSMEDAAHGSESDEGDSVFGNSNDAVFSTLRAQYE